MSILYRNKASGKVCIVLRGLADGDGVFIEATMTPAVLCQEIEDEGWIYVRPVSEFFDTHERIGKIEILEAGGI